MHMCTNMGFYLKMEKSRRIEGDDASKTNNASEDREGKGYMLYDTGQEELRLSTRAGQSSDKHRIMKAGMTNQGGIERDGKIKRFKTQQAAVRLI